MEKTETKKIFVVPYCHPDWAWTFFRRWHEKRYVLVIEEVLDILKEHPGYRFYLDSYITETEPFLRLRPKRTEELRRMVTKGKIAVCGTFTNLRPSMVGEESQIRDILIGREKYGKCFPGADLSVYASTVDVSVGHPQMPQLLVLGGYQYYRFWRPDAALSAKRVPREFYWQGLDGSRILCSRGFYGGLAENDDITAMLRKELACDEGLFTTGLRWFNQGMDDTRPLRTVSDGPLHMFEFIKDWNARERAQIFFATPVEAFKEIEQEKHRLQVVRESLDPCEVCYNAGWGGNNGLFHFRQENDRALTDMETWCTMAAEYDYPYPSRHMRELWEEHLLTCAHATQWLFTRDFNEMRKRAQWVALSSERLRLEALKWLTRHLPVRSGVEMVLFNPLPYEREEKVPLTISFHDMPPGSFALLDGNAQNIPYQMGGINRNETDAREFMVTAKVKMPPCGYNTIEVKKGMLPPEVSRIPFQAEWSGHEIKTVVVEDRRYTAGTDSGFGHMKLYRVNTARGILHAGPVTGDRKVLWRNTVLLEKGHLYDLYRSEGKAGKHDIVRDIAVYRDEPRLEYRFVIDWREDDGFITLEWPRLPNLPLYGDIPFGVEEKKLTCEPYGRLPGIGKYPENVERQRKGMFYSRTFVSQGDAAGGVSYINHDATCYYLLNETTIANIVLNSVTKLKGWEQFVNPYIKGGGKHRFVSHLIFHRGNWKNAHMARRAHSLRHQIECIFPDRTGTGELPSTYGFVKLAPENLVMTAFYREGDECVFRFYESEGKKTSAHLDLPQVAVRVRKTNLPGNTLEKLKSGRKVRMAVRPREIVTIRWKWRSL